MIDPTVGRLPDYKLDPPAEPLQMSCDGCVEGFVACDADCGPDCPGGHAHILCNGTGKLAASIRSFRDEAPCRCAGPCRC